MTRELTARRAYRKRLDQLMHAIFIGAIALAVFVLIVLLWDILSQGAAGLNWRFLTSYASRFASRAGILAPLVGSFYVILLTAVIALPVGVATAVYLEFYASNNWFNRLLQTNIANLAGVPSIVYGLFGLAFFVRAMNFDRSIIAAAFTMALLILLVVIVNTQEALRAIPPSLAHGAYALGASRWQVVRTVILPAAFARILTGAILALSRALGETAPLLTVGAWAYVAYLPRGLKDGFTVLPIQVYVWSSMPQEEFRDLAATTIIVLLAVLLSINGAAIWLRNKYQKKAEW